MELGGQARPGPAEATGRTLLLVFPKGSEWALKGSEWASLLRSAC